MDVSQLTAFLAPLLAPLLVKTHEAAAEAVATVGEAAWNQARELWGRLADRIADRPAAKEAAEDVAKAPDDQRKVSALEVQLEKILEGDAALREEITRLWQQGEARGITVTTVKAIGERSFAAVDVRNATVTTGDQFAPQPRPDEAARPKEG